MEPRAESSVLAVSCPRQGGRMDALSARISVVMRAITSFGVLGVALATGIVVLIGGAPSAWAQSSSSPTPGSAIVQPSTPPSAAIEGVRSSAPVSPSIWTTTGIVLHAQADESADRRPTWTARIRIDDGERSGAAAGKEVTIVVPRDGPGMVPLAEGEQVSVRVQLSPSGELSGIVLDRTHPGVWIVLVLTGALLVVVARKSGALTILTFALAVLFVLFVAVPLILRGVNPLWAALLATTLFSASAALIVFQWSRATAAAAIGAIGSLLLSILVSRAFLGLTHLVDFRDPTVDALRALPGIPTSSLALGMSLIVSCGAVVHVVARITGAIFLESERHPEHGLTSLLDVGLTHGRRVLPAIAETALWALFGLALPEVLLGAAQVSVFRGTLIGDIALLIVLPLNLLASVSLAVILTTVAAAVLATRPTNA